MDDQSQPALFNDATRSIRRFPGTAGQDLSSRTFVRGGTPDDNCTAGRRSRCTSLFIWWGCPSTSASSTRAIVGGLDFYSGVLPVEYGGRMGGLLNLHLPDPPAELGGRISAGVLDASALASGPLSAESGDWMMFGRRGLLGRFVNG